MRVLSHEPIYGGERFDLERVYVSARDGTEQARDVVRHPGAVAIHPTG